MTFRDTGSFNLRSAIPGIVESLSPKWTLIHDAVNLTNGAISQSFAISGYKDYLISVNDVKHQWNTASAVVIPALQVSLEVNGSTSYTYTISSNNVQIADGIFLSSESGGLQTLTGSPGIAYTIVYASTPETVTGMTYTNGMSCQAYFTTNNNGFHAFESISATDYTNTTGRMWARQHRGTIRTTSTTPSAFRIYTTTVGGVTFLSGVVSIWGR